jgi:hypothetical protein
MTWWPPDDRSVLRWIKLEPFRRQFRARQSKDNVLRDSQFAGRE